MTSVYGPGAKNALEEEAGWKAMGLGSTNMQCASTSQSLIVDIVILASKTKALVTNRNYNFLHTINLLDTEQSDPV